MYNAEDVSFSTDGTRILFTQNTASGLQIFYLPVIISGNTITTNGNPAALTAGYMNFHPRYSTDGGSIIFVSTRSGSQDVFIMNSNGTNQHSIGINPLPVNPAYPHFSPYTNEKIAYLSTNRVYIAKLNSSTGIWEASLHDPEIATTGGFDWSAYTPELISVNRQLVFDRLDPLIPLTYTLKVNVRQTDPPNTILINETLYTDNGDPAKNWTLTDATWNDSPISTSNGESQGTLQWIINIDDIPGGESVREGTLTLTIDLSGDTTLNKLRSFTGQYFNGTEFEFTTGDTYVELNHPYCPPDSGRDWEISDNELLLVIDDWANQEQIHGWPVALSEWDNWILSIIDYWAAGGYVYNPTGGKPNWEAI